MIQENVNQTGMSQKQPKNVWKMLFVGVLSIALILSVFLEQKEAQVSTLVAQCDELISYMTKLEASYFTFARTLEKKQVPSLSQLQSWLALDQTDTIEYNAPDFVCTDFAAMLVVHARTQEWQMGLVSVHGSDTSTHEEWNHAFNAILTTEGLVYVEPQSDEVWWYQNHVAIQTGGNCRIWQNNPHHNLYQ